MSARDTQQQQLEALQQEWGKLRWDWLSKNRECARALTDLTAMKKLYVEAEGLRAQQLSVSELVSKVLNQLLQQEVKTQHVLVEVDEVEGAQGGNMVVRRGEAPRGGEGVQMCVKQCVKQCSVLWYGGCCWCLYNDFDIWRISHNYWLLTI